MRYSLKDVFTQLTNPVGRRELLVGQGRRLWPLLRPLAAGYRRICLPSTVMIAVVGSLGKSTTMRAVAAAFGLPVPNVPPGNSWSMLAFSLLSIRPHARYGVLEAGISSTGWMEQYGRMIRPDITVVTTIASEHHRSLGTLADIRSEKAAMVRCLPADGLAILNGDDPHVKWMAGATPARVITYGFGSGNDIQVVEFECRWPEGNWFAFRIGDRTHTIASRLCGRNMVYPILAAVAAGVAVGRDIERVLTALAGLEPTPNRMENVRLDNEAWILNDSYKGTIESVFSSLEVLGGIPAGRRIAVLGEVEDAPGSLGVIYRQVGMLSAKCADTVIAVCGRNSAGPLRAGVASAKVGGAAVTHIGRDWYSAYGLLTEKLRSGDVVLLKGRRTQRLERLFLALQGVEVGCRVPACKCSARTCRACPMLKTGWEGRQVTV